MPSAAIAHTCEECGRSFKCSGHLTRHKLTHTDSRPYVCDHPGCTRSYTRAENLRRHQLSHTPDEMPFQCSRDGCEKKFATRQKLTRHVALHDRPKPFECAECGMAFRKKFELARHRVVHTGKMPCVCEEEGCGMAFATPSHLRRHVASRHIGKKYICSEDGCLGTGVVFRKFSELTRHMTREHPREYKCAECEKSFAARGLLRRHVLTHTVPVVDRLWYVCKVKGCEARYTSAGSLSNHVRAKHTMRDCFVCRVCERTFSFARVLKNHLQVVHGVTPDSDSIQRVRACGKRGGGGIRKRGRVGAVERVESAEENDGETETASDERNDMAQTVDDASEGMSGSTSTPVTIVGDDMWCDDNDAQGAEDDFDESMSVDNDGFHTGAEHDGDEIAPQKLVTAPSDTPMAIPNTPNPNLIAVERLPQSAVDELSCEKILAAAAAAGSAPAFNAQGFRAVSAQ